MCLFQHLIRLIDDIFRQEETLTQETLRPLSEHLTELNSALQDQVKKEILT